MRGKRVPAVWREIFRKFPALLFGEAGADADVLQRPRIVEKAEQQRSDSRALTFLVPPKSGDNAVAIALVLNLEHHALVRLIRA